MNKLAMTAVVGLMVVAAGCTTLDGTQNEPFTRTGLPKAQYLVGGGFEIDFAAPSNGVAHLIDVSSGRYVKTEYLDEDEDFEMPYVVEVWVDTDQSTAVDLRLYFIPDETIPDMQ